MDMMAMEFEPESFDAVIDKATMDVIMTDNADPWDPSPEVKERAQKTLSNVFRVLKRGGVFVQVSFDQPHFRKKLLVNDDLYAWTLSQRNIDHGLGYFMYVMKKAEV